MILSKLPPKDDVEIIFPFPVCLYYYFIYFLTFLFLLLSLSVALLRELNGSRKVNNLATFQTFLCLFLPAIYNLRYPIP